MKKKKGAARKPVRDGGHKMNGFCQQEVMGKNGREKEGL
jgi:hypothetical protein